MLDNAEDVMHSLEEFSKLKPKLIPRELEDYLGYVAKTGDPVFKWSMVKYLFREKMLSVINDFYEDTLTVELPPCPNVDLFNYDRMKTSLLERLESFHGAPFTIQRICELLTNPRKEYNRADKFMRAIEKNILVVSTREPGRFSDLDCETTQECSINGIREVGETLDSTFIINDLGSGPDSSSIGSELPEPMPDANHLNTVERVSPVHDQEVSSDSDDSSMENGHVAIEAPSEKTNGLENEHRSITEETDGTSVSSTDMSLSLEESNEIPSEEVLGNAISLTHESVISNQQMGFVVGANLGEVIGTVESTPVETTEPCILPDGSLLNEVISETQTDTAKEAEKSDTSLDLNKSDVLDNTPVASEQTSELVPMAKIEAADCDTSQIERNSKCDDSAVNDNSIIDDSEVPCDTKDQVTSCDTVEANLTLNSEYLGSNQVQSNISPSCDATPSDIMDQPNIIPESDIVGADREQPNVIDQSNLVQTKVSAEIAPSNDVAPSESAEQSHTSSHSNIVEQFDYAAQSDETTKSEDTTQSDDSTQSGDIVQSDNVPSEIIPQSGDVVQTGLDQLKFALSDSSQLDIIKQPEIDSQPVTVDQLVTVDQSVAVVQLVATDHSTAADQSCDVITSGDLAPSEPMAESSINDQPECSQSDNLGTESESQTEQIVQMEIPSDTESIIEPAQSNQPDCASSEPMDVDE